MIFPRHFQDVNSRKPSNNERMTLYFEVRMLCDLEGRGTCMCGFPQRYCLCNWEMLKRFLWQELHCVHVPKQCAVDGGNSCYGGNGLSVKWTTLFYLALRFLTVVQAVAIHALPHMTLSTNRPFLTWMYLSSFSAHPSPLLLYTNLSIHDLKYWLSISLNRCFLTGCAPSDPSGLISITST